jgi:hypothetical protein
LSLSKPSASNRNSKEEFNIPFKQHK